MAAWYYNNVQHEMNQVLTKMSEFLFIVFASLLYLSWTKLHNHILLEAFRVLFEHEMILLNHRGFSCRV